MENIRFTSEERAKLIKLHIKSFLCPQGKYTPNSIMKETSSKPEGMDVLHQDIFRKLDRLGY